MFVPTKKLGNTVINSDPLNFTGHVVPLDAECEEEISDLFKRRRGRGHPEQEHDLVLLGLRPGRPVPDCHTGILRGLPRVSLAKHGRAGLQAGLRHSPLMTCDTDNKRKIHSGTANIWSSVWSFSRLLFHLISSLLPFCQKKARLIFVCDICSF